MSNCFGVFHIGESFEAQRLGEEVTAYGLQLIDIDRRDINAQIHDRVTYYWKDAFLPDMDWAVSRPAKFGDDTQQTKVQRPMLVQWLTMQGTTVLDAATTITTSVNNKWDQLVKIADAGLPVVNTDIFSRIEQIPQDYFQVRKVIKRVDGAVGNAVWMVQTFDEARNIIEREKIGNLIFEDLYPGGTDYRLLVLGDVCLGGMKRTAKENEFRSNFSLGGSVQPVAVSEEMKELALRAAKVMNLEYAGVDLFPVDGKPRVLEVNRSPQFRGFEQATGVNVAKKIVEYLVDKRRKDAI